MTTLNELPAVKAAVEKHPDQVEFLQSVVEIIDERMHILATGVDQRFEAVEAALQDVEEEVPSQLVKLGKKMADVLTQNKLAPELVAEWDALLVDLLEDEEGAQ